MISVECTTCTPSCKDSIKIVGAFKVSNRYYDRAEYPRKGGIFIPHSYTVPSLCYKRKGWSFVRGPLWVPFCFLIDLYPFSFLFWLCSLLGFCCSCIVIVYEESVRSEGSVPVLSLPCKVPTCVGEHECSPAGDLAVEGYRFERGVPSRDSEWSPTSSGMQAPSLSLTL